MSKAISMEAQMTSVATRSDGSLALRFAGPEMSPSEKTTVFEIQGKNVKLLIQPMDGEPDELVDVKTEFNTKTPSMRLRASLFVAYTQAGSPGEWEDFYRHKMEGIINEVKRHLQPA